MGELSIVASACAILVSLINVAAVIWRVSSLVANLESRQAASAERFELRQNAIAERVNNIGLRIETLVEIPLIRQRLESIEDIISSYPETNARNQAEIQTLKEKVFSLKNHPAVRPPPDRP